MKKYFGFSLIEALVVLIIAAILSSVAYPSYLNYMRQTRRTYATTNLFKIQAQFEQYFIQNNAYPTTIATAYGGASAPTSTYYTFGCSGCTTSAYTLTATVAGDQANDADCGGTAPASFTLSNSGAKVAYNNSNASNTTACWGN